MSDRMTDVPPDPALDPDRIAAGVRAEAAKFNHRLALDDELYGWNRKVS